MTDRLERTRMLFGGEAMDRLARSRVAVFGLGGVGGYVVEALARSGVGALDLIDSDSVSLSNLNRQILATADTIGMAKVDAAAARVAAVAPECRVRTYKMFYLPGETEFPFHECDYIVDAIDTVTGKLGLVMAAREAKVPIVSAMGTGNKLDPTRLRVSDLSETSICPLARIMRKELRRRGVEHLKVVWSPEEPITPAPPEEAPPEGRRAIPGSNAFVPAAAGLILAAEVVRDLIGEGKP